MVDLVRDKVVFPSLVHRLVLLAFVGPCPPGMEGRHGDAIRGNCFLQNLCWGTRSENAFDKVSHGNMPNYQGMNHPQVKLNDEKVLEIRRLCAIGLPKPRIAKMFDITNGNVHHINNRKSWRHLP